MNSWIHAIETAVPVHAYQQAFASACMQRWIGDSRLRRIAARVYKQSGIECRYSVLPDFLPGEAPLLFHEGADGSLDEPSTGRRNAVFAGHYQPVVRDAVRRVFASGAAFQPADVTHVITVSCTGFTNPGPDLFIQEAFGLADSVERYHIGFMGCYAAFPALRMADQFCRANPEAVVLIVCIELCTLHLQIKPTEDSLLANALFADGAATALVSARPPDPARRTLAIDSFSTRILREGEQDMAWTIGDTGFDMSLTAYVPKILGANSRSVTASFLAQCECPADDVGVWAVHPGGAAILRAFEQGLGLGADALRRSREVLRDYGNMSSATILFVLRRIMEEALEPDGTPVAAMAFGPGLTVEFGLLKTAGVPLREPVPAAEAGRTP